MKLTPQHFHTFCYNIPPNIIEHLTKMSLFCQETDNIHSTIILNISTAYVFYYSLGLRSFYLKILIILFSGILF